MIQPSDKHNTFKLIKQFEFPTLDFYLLIEVAVAVLIPKKKPHWNRFFNGIYHLTYWTIEWGSGIDDESSMSTKNNTIDSVWNIHFFKCVCTAQTTLNLKRVNIWATNGFKMFRDPLNFERIHCFWHWIEANGMKSK